MSVDRALKIAGFCWKLRAHKERMAWSGRSSVGTTSQRYKFNGCTLKLSKQTVAYRQFRKENNLYRDVNIATLQYA